MRPDPDCGAIMPRTNPPGAFVCALPHGHAEWHEAPLFDDDVGYATWRDETIATDPLAGDPVLAVDKAAQPLTSRSSPDKAAP